MCGIAGVWRSAGLAPDDVQAVVRMNEAQAHRGPNAGAIHVDEHVVLGHRRLSIIDTSAAGNQPMCNEDGSVWLAYNGELYNHPELRAALVARGHRFTSRSDSEVIVHGYEEWNIRGLLDRLCGMFAFALYDPRVGVLIARDRLGIKPLYYHAAAGGSLIFASEVKALAASGLVPIERDVTAVAGFLLGGSIAAPRTIIRNVSSLLPGHYLVCSSNRAGGLPSITKYWDLPLPEALGQDGADVSAGGALDTVGALLQDSVSRHLVSDVPVGVFLSGGVDSGAIVALASRSEARTQPLTTLTVTFDEKAFSEERQTSAVAKRFRTDHRDVRVTQGEFVAEIPHMLAAMDQPTNDGVNTYFVSKAARAAGLTVVLSGLGGDEVFWGYPHYRWLHGRTRRWLARCPAAGRRIVSRGAALWGRARGGDKWMRLEFVEPGVSAKELYLLMRGFFAPRHVMDLMEIGQRDLDMAVEEQFGGVSSIGVGEADVTAFNYIEFKRYLHDQLLRDTDVFSMAHSIEVRVPLLDHPIVEHAMKTGTTLKMANTVNKPLLVGAVADPLVLQAGERGKRGFSLPMASWMKASGGELEEMATASLLLNKKAVRARWREFRDNRLHWSRAWALTVLGAQSQRPAGS